MLCVVASIRSVWYLIDMKPRYSDPVAAKLHQYLDWLTGKKRPEGFKVLYAVHFMKVYGSDLIQLEREKQSIGGRRGGKRSGKTHPRASTEIPTRRQPTLWDQIAEIIGVSATNCSKGRRVIGEYAGYAYEHGRLISRAMQVQEPMAWLYVEGLLNVHAVLRAKQVLSVQEQNDIVKTIKDARKIRRTKLTATLIREALKAKKNSQPGSPPSS